MKRLTLDDYSSYLYKTYSSWLGKIIGIRLGAPVEGWSHEKIEEKYHGKHGYLIDYGIFAADDDSNGPLFFVRSLREKKDISAKDIGNSFLNYIQEYSGFFWWGGVGVSSEHTAYENLKNGIEAPRSGSKLQNGIVIAEQIGGQIFSDCWGYVSGYNPDRAKKLASMASSVTHDENGIEGGIFVAVAICLAYQYDTIKVVIDKALEYLDHDKEYYKVMKVIENYHEEHPYDFASCFQFIQNNYGYDRYPGTCHIIPNACLMMMAMLYGNGDFDLTMEMLNNCGWDTDCNCGNVGSILGACLGAYNIDTKWIVENRDIVNASSCIGSLNIETISESAKLFTKLAYQFEGIEIVDDTHFHLPYAYEGFFGDCKVDNGLKAKGTVYKYAYYLGKDIYDSRYDPEFSPILYPGYQIRVQADQDILIFAKDLDEKEEDGCNELTIAKGRNKIIHTFGFKGNEYSIFDYQIRYTPEIDYDFTSWNLDTYGPRYGGDYKDNIRAFVIHHGKFELNHGLLGCGLATSGNLKDKYHEIEWRFIPLVGEQFELVFNFEGYLHYQTVGIRENNLVVVEKNIEEEIINSWPIKYEKGTEIILKTIHSVGKMELVLNDSFFEFDYFDNLHGLYGFNIDRNGKCLNLGLKLR